MGGGGQRGGVGDRVCKERREEKLRQGCKINKYKNINLELFLL